jgi:dephospho-CoA kinase
MDLGYVFGYASLAAGGTRVVALRGHRRVWGVAMDNRLAVPGYKIYEAPDGSRPAVDVAFLDLAPDASCAVEGSLLAVDAVELAALDERERQYRRVDVTAAIDPAVDGGGSVWAYVGRAEGRARASGGRAGAREVVIQRAYVDLVEAAFRTLGPGHLARYRASTEPPPFPVQELARVNLP